MGKQKKAQPLTETRAFEETPIRISFRILSGDGKSFLFHKVLFDKKTEDNEQYPE